MERLSIRTLPACLLALALLGVAFGTGAHPGNDDPFPPHRGNTFAGDGQEAGLDGLQDLWDPDGNGIRNLQYDMGAFQASVAEHDYRPPSMGATMLRQPVDYESPGLIFWDWSWDWQRRGMSYGYCEYWTLGALDGQNLCNGPRLDPQVPYRSALHYHDVNELPWGYMGSTSGNPCVQGPGPMSIPIIVVPPGIPVLPPHPRPDNPPPDNVEQGYVGDELGETPYYQTDEFGYIDALENLQTTPPSHALPFSDFRYHILRNSLQGGANGTAPGAGPQAPESYFEDIAGPPDGARVSPGHDGFIFGRFQYPVVDGPGPDIRVYEEWGSVGYYCLFGAMDQEGPYYLIGTSYKSPGGGTHSGNEDFDLSLYYNAPGAVDKGGPVVRYFGIVTGFHNMHRLTADFTWTPDVPPAFDADGEPVHPTGEPVEPVREQDITFLDASTRHGHPTWQYPGSACLPDPPYNSWCGPNHSDETEDPVRYYRWTFNDPNAACNGPTTTTGGCLNATRPVPDVRDLNWSHMKNPVHRFKEPGVYNVCHTAITKGQFVPVDPDNPGRAGGVPGNLIDPRKGIGPFSDTVCKDVDVWNYDPVVRIFASRLEGCMADHWRFLGDATDPEDDNFTSWSWEFSDGSMHTGRLVYHSFPEHGTYQGKLTVRDEYGGIGTAPIVVSTHSRDNHPPVLQKIPPRIVTPGTALDFVVQAFDPDCDELSYAYYDMPEGALLVSTDPITFRWVAGGPGLYEGITYEVTDGLHRVRNTTWVRVVDPALDEDGDGAGANVADNCPGVANHGQHDADGDGIGDACEPIPAFVRIDDTDSRPGDIDGDGVADASDNCVAVPNPDQFDMDLDGRGDVCDVDLDGDGVVQFAPGEGVLLDNCAFVANQGQEDADRHGAGDACDGGRATLAGQTCADCDAVDALRGAELEESRGPTSSTVVALAMLGVAALVGIVFTAEGVRARRRR